MEQEYREMIENSYFIAKNLLLLKEEIYKFIRMGATVKCKQCRFTVTFKYRTILIVYRIHPQSGFKIELDCSNRKEKISCCVNEITPYIFY